MTAAGQGAIWGVSPSAISFRACWSGYRTTGGNPDAPQVNPDGSLNLIQRCTIAGVDPTTSPELLPCPPGSTTASDDTGSDNPDNQVTIYACFKWAPPLAGFVFIPSLVTMRSVVTEVIHQQQ